MDLFESLMNENVRLTEKFADSFDEETGDYLYTDNAKVPEILKGKIKRIRFADDVEVIAKSAFAGCTALESVEVPKGVVSIGPSAFEECSSLKSVRLPSTIEEIRAYSFAGCISLKEITIPERVTWIAFGAFEDSGLTYVKILSKNLEYIADDAFEGCIPLLDATEATFTFNFSEWCEKNDLACEVESE